MHAPTPSARDRMSMYNDNALKIGLFGANCSSGRAVTMVPERWTGNWEDNLALARMADEAGIEFMLPVGRWKGYGGDTDYQGTTLETITWATGLLAPDQAHDRVRHRARAAVPSDHRRQADGHRRSRRRGPLRPQHRGRLERGRVRDVRRHAARPRGALRLRAGVARRRQAWRGRPQDDFDFDGKFIKLEEHPRQAQALRRHAAADHERRRLADRPGLRDPQLRRLLHAGLAHLDGGDRAERVSAAKADAAAARPRARRLYASASSPAGRPRRRPRSTTTTPSIENADWSAVDGILAQEEHHRARPSAQEEFQQSAPPATPNGMGGLPMVGDPDHVAQTTRRSEPGRADAASASRFVNYVEELPFFCDEVLPRLERAGLREGH